MAIFKTRGAYIYMNDLTKEGYCVRDRNGNLKSRKYGFLDKLNDIIGYGKTMHIDYSYFVFDEDPETGDITLYEKGALITELHSLLEDFSQNCSFRRSSSELNFVEERNKLIFSVAKTSYATFNSSGTELYHTFFSEFYEKEIERKFTFYPFTGYYWEIDWKKKS